MSAMKIEPLVELTEDGKSVRVTMTLNDMAVPPNEEFRSEVEKAVKQVLSPERVAKPTAYGNSDSGSSYSWTKDPDGDGWVVRAWDMDPDDIQTLEEDGELEVVVSKRSGETQEVTVVSIISEDRRVTLLEPKPKARKPRGNGNSLDLGIDVSGD